MTNRPLRRLLARFVLVCSLLAAVALPLTAPAQNLAMRRLIEDAKNTDVPACEQAVKEKAGVAIPVEVDFASLDNPDRFLSLKDLLQGISDGIGEVAKDKAGKDAVATKVRKIVLTRDEKGYDASFKDGVLTCRASFASNYAESMAGKIKATLEESL